jgi:hypothetical protein
MKYKLSNTPVTFDYNYMLYTFNESLADISLTMCILYLALYYSVKYSIPEFKEDLKNKLTTIKYFILWATTMFH